MSGKVWLVGAGPGDIGLLTVKGKALIEKADVIIYDHLVGNEILSSLDDKKKLINVGKLSGHHPIPQEQINRILIEEAKRGQKVIRLKGGDPFLFGRGGEEMAELHRSGIPFEVVPGVTSSLAVPAYSGIPVTHRDYASSVHIITGHKKRDAQESIDYRALVQTKGTLVFLMGVTALPDIRRKLLEAGMEPDMPAAILQEGTTAGQRTIISTVGELEERAETEKVRPPAVIVVGKVCKLSETLSWREGLPLYNKRVVLTRPRKLMRALADRLRAEGAEVLEFPTIRTAKLEDNERLFQAFLKIETYDWIVFTSQIGVQIFFEQMQKKQMDIRRLSGAKFAAIGEGTYAALCERGVYADVMPDIYDGESLGKALSCQGIGGCHILIPRAEKGNEQLVPILKQSGAVVEDIPVYRTAFYTSETVSVKKEIQKGTIDLVAFTSSSTVEGFAAATEGLDYSKIKAACIGIQTAGTASKYGMRCYVAKKATLEDLSVLIFKILQK